MTVMEPEVITTPDAQTDAGDRDRFTHIIPRGADGRSAEAVIMEARVYAKPIRALCGKMWIPDRDPRKYPVCQTCTEIMFNNIRGQ